MYNITTEPAIKDISHNYTYKNRVFILDELTIENTSHILADISDMIEYERKHSQVIEWFFNSPGGSVAACKSLLSMMKFANLQGITNITYVIGEAASSASILAINGNDRYIMSYASHYIHYGSSGSGSAHPMEAKRNYEDDKKFYNWVHDTYLEHSNIPKARLEELMEHEGGYLYAKDCIKYKLADHLLD